MPLYEYRCMNCGRLFEKRVTFEQSKKLPECPACQSEDTQKQLSLFASKAAAGSSVSSCGPSSSPFT